MIIDARELFNAARDARSPHPMRVFHGRAVLRELAEQHEARSVKEVAKRLVLSATIHPVQHW